MTGVLQRGVAVDEAMMRLDRWFKRHFPDLTHGRLERLLRTGQVRVDGRRAEASTRLEAGQTVRVPPLGAPAVIRREAKGSDRQAGVSAADLKTLKAMIVHEDDAVIALNKPAGIAVQGGSGIARHIDGMLDALARHGERPKLVHRLDRDTSGILLLGRTAQAARALSEAFRSKQAVKRYDALIVGVPTPSEGRIDAALVKPDKGKARVALDRTAEDAKSAVTYYKVLDHAGKRVARLALYPLTGRTHQLRVHCAAIGTPILGDGKYGGQAAFIPGAEVESRLHLHASRIRLPHPKGGMLDVTAPLSVHLRTALAYFGLADDQPITLPEEL